MSSWDLPSVRGRYRFRSVLANSTWFQVGGFADISFRPADKEDLTSFLVKRPSSLPLTCLGVGSNVLVRDAGIRGCVIRLGSGFSDISIQGTLVIAGAACLGRTVAVECAQQGLSGLEFLIGIPGSIGGAIAMNAGAYGSEIKDALQWIEIVDSSGHLRRLERDSLKMEYRKGNLPTGAIVIQAAFECQRGNPESLINTLNSFLKKREETQPIQGRTGGSTFKNPPNGPKAWELIDQAGCRGMKIGGAQVSEKHCNFLLNLGGATAGDIESLGESVQEAVLKKHGILLEWEIIRIGEDFRNTGERT